MQRCIIDRYEHHKLSHNKNQLLLIHCSRFLLLLPNVLICDIRLVLICIYVPISSCHIFIHTSFGLKNVDFKNEWLPFSNPYCPTLERTWLTWNYHLLSNNPISPMVNCRIGNRWTLKIATEPIIECILQDVIF